MGPYDPCRHLRSPRIDWANRSTHWEALFIDIHIDRERSDRVNPTPGRSPMSDTLQHVRNQ